jgi:hypothetical protein
MPDDLVVNKSKFDALLGKMLNTPPLPKSEVKVANPKPNKRKKSLTLYIENKLLSAKGG